MATCSRDRRRATTWVVLLPFACLAIPAYGATAQPAPVPEATSAVAVDSPASPALEPDAPMPTPAAIVAPSEPPAIEIDPVQSVAANETLEIRARLASTATVGGLFIHAKGELEPDYQRSPMRLDARGVWVASLGPSPLRGHRVDFFVDAVDAQGNRLASAGSTRAPWVVRVVEPLPPKSTSGSRLVLALVIVALIVLGGLAYTASRRRPLRVARKAAAGRDEQFWRRLLDPLFDTPEGATRDAAIEKFCAQAHDHPDLGPLVVSAGDVKRRMEGLRGMPRVSHPGPAQVAARMMRRPTGALAQVEEDIFWLRLLAPLRAATPCEREAVYGSLSSRPHSHPTKGKQLFDRVALQREFERTRAMNLEQLEARRRNLTATDAESECAAAVQTASEESLSTSADLAATGPDGRDASAVNLASETFWYNLLAPLKDLPPGLQQDALRDLSSRPHLHPVEGNRLFSRALIAREFAWVKQADPDGLHARWSAATLAMLQLAEDSAESDRHSTGEAPDRPAASVGLPGETPSPSIDERVDAMFAAAGPASAPGDPLQ